MRNFYVAFVCLFPAFAGAQDAVRPRAVSVESSALQEVGPWGAAALPQGLVPLPSDLWRGADPGTLALLFARIMPDQRLPSLQNLTRQAIFSGGTAPTTDPDVTQSRFEAANRFGPAEATARLVFGIPRLSSQAGLAAIAIDAGLRVGRIDEACGLIEAVAARPLGTAWLEARATCYALNNEADAANLSVDLAKARGLTDTWLGRAIAAVPGPLSAPPPFRVDSGRAIALSLRAKLKPPITLVSTQDPMALSALIGTQDFIAALPPEERLAFARNGASRGVIPLATLVGFQPVPELMPEVTPVPAIQPALGSTPGPAASTPSPVVVSTEPVPPVPAQITAKMLGAPTLALRAIEARLALVDIKAVMTTQPGLMTLADVPVLTEAALWNGDGALATSIASLAPQALDPRLALVIALYDPTKQAQSVETRIDAAGADPVARRLAMRDAMVAWSAGVPTGGGLSLLVQTGLPWGPAGNAGLRAALELAANRGSKGEVILLSALALQGVEPQAIDPETLVVSVKALRRVGLPDAANDLARDYLLATFVTLPVRQTIPARQTVRPRAAPTTSLRATPSTPLPPNQRPAAINAPPITAPPRQVTPPPAPRPPTSRAKPSWGNR